MPVLPRVDATTQPTAAGRCAAQRSAVLDGAGAGRAGTVRQTWRRVRPGAYATGGRAPGVAVLRSLAASIVLVFVGGVVALCTHGGAVSKLADAVPTGLRLRPAGDPAADGRLDLQLARQASSAAVLAETRARARQLEQLEWLERLRAAAARRAAALRASRAAQRQALVVDSSAEAWANTPYAIRVANCESGGGRGDTSATYDGNPHLRAANGHYGKWQFSLPTWQSVGGSGNPADASVYEQDYRAWLLWKRDGWSQWQCAG